MLSLFLRTWYQSVHWRRYCNVKNGTANAAQGLIVNGSLSFGAMKKNSTLVDTKRRNPKKKKK
jgi:hypothetical protein